MTALSVSLVQDRNEETMGTPTLGIGKVLRVTPGCLYAVRFNYEIKLVICNVDCLAFFNSLVCKSQ